MPRVKLFDESEVLNKAINLFWKQGYAATSVQDLVKHLGINRASLYDTFGDKYELFKKALDFYIKENHEGLIRFFDSRPNVKEGILELFNVAINVAVSDKDCKGCFVVNTTTELIPNDKELLVVLESSKKDFQNLLYEYLKKGKEAGQLKETIDLKSLASLFYTIYSGIRVVAKVSPNGKELTDSINVVISLLD